MTFMPTETPGQMTKRGLKDLATTALTGRIAVSSPPSIDKTAMNLASRSRKFGGFQGFGRRAMRGGKR